MNNGEASPGQLVEKPEPALPGNPPSLPRGQAPDLVELHAEEKAHLRVKLLPRLPWGGQEFLVMKYAQDRHGSVNVAFGRRLRC